MKIFSVGFCKTFDICTYDYQKVHLTYYLSVTNRKKEERRKIINDSIIFFNENKKRIFKYRDKGSILWLNYFYNIKRLNEEGFSDLNVDEIIKSIEDTLTQEIITTIKSRHFYNSRS